MLFTMYDTDMLDLTGVAWFDCRIRYHCLGEVQMRVKVRSVLLSSSWVCPMEENVAVIVIQGELPPIQGPLAGRFEEWAQHPVSCRWLQDGMNHESTCDYDGSEMKREE